MIRKVAIIIERTDVALGGAERSISEVADALSVLGLEVHLLAAKGAACVANTHILCQNLPGKRVSLATFGAAIQRHLAQNHYDIVHSVLPFDFADLYQPRGGTYAESLRRNAASYANPAVRLFKRLTACVNLRRMELLRAERRICRGAEGPRVAALSQYVVEQLHRHYGTPPERIIVTLNGVATNRKVDPIEAKTLRSQIVGASQNDCVVLLFAAHNFRLKGLDRLIQALAKTKSSARLAVVGEGRIEGPRRLARRLGVADRVVFLGPLNQVQNAIAAADVGILPTFYDPSSRFILETLAAGKPVVTTRFNGATDHFTDGRHGIVVESPDNIGALAKAIGYFTVRENLYRAVHAIAQDRLVEKISIGRVANELLDVYERIQERKKRL